MTKDLISFAKLFFKRQLELIGQIFPEDWIGCKLRGLILRPFFLECGRNLQIGIGAKIEHADKIRVGNDVYIGHGCWISGHGGGITLEDEVMLGPYVTMVSNDHVSQEGSARFAKGIPAPIAIGKGCWIAARALITAGVELGPGCVIGGGAVVTKSFPANSKLLGVPARAVNLELK
jgi:acetyltransferase-like isoleucine patch superfamily enzyme